METEKVSETEQTTATEKSDVQPAVLPGFRKVAAATNMAWSGDEESPAFLKPMFAASRYRQLSQESKYWTMAFYAMLVASLLCLLPPRLSLVAHLVCLLVIAVYAARRAVQAVRARANALRLDRAADASQQGLGVEIRDVSGP